MSSATPDTRELAARDSNGLHVLLLWHPREDELTRLCRGHAGRKPLPARGRT